MTQRSTLAYLTAHKRATAPQIAAGTGIGTATAKGNLARLETKGQARRTGAAMSHTDKKGRNYYVPIWEAVR